jgi:hypothetical protein
MCFVPDLGKDLHAPERSAVEKLVGVKPTECYAKALDRLEKPQETDIQFLFTRPGD